MAISINYMGDKYGQELTYISDAIASFGVTADEMTEALNKLADLMKSIECVNARIDLIEDKLSQLGPVSDAKTENPNQKDDLEILNRIVPTDDFLILGDIGWSSDIIDLDKTNIFLN